MSKSQRAETFKAIEQNQALLTKARKAGGVYGDGGHIDRLLAEINRLCWSLHT